MAERKRGYRQPAGSAAAGDKGKHGGRHMLGQVSEISVRAFSTGGKTGDRKTAVPNISIGVEWIGLTAAK